MKKILLLFDVDGTLTKPRNKVEDNVISFFKKIKKEIDLGIISGSDYSKIEEQLGNDFLNLFDHVFTENGLVSYYQQECIHKNNIINKLGEDIYQELVNDILKILSQIKLPIKRGHFIELRTGMINISPIGRSCNQQEREDFYHYDLENNIRHQIINELKTKYNKIVDFSIGGQISIDIFPKNWNKTYCLQLIHHDLYTIYFFGDKMIPGGNDFELSCDSRIIPISVKDPEDMMNKVLSIIHNECKN